MMVEYCNELWGSRGFGGSGMQMEDLFKQVRPSARSPAGLARGSRLHVFSSARLRS